MARSKSDITQKWKNETKYQGALLAKKEFINKLLFDYDLVETDKDCNYNISGALLDATLWEDSKEKEI